MADAIETRYDPALGQAFLRIAQDYGIAYGDVLLVQMGQETWTDLKLSEAYGHRPTSPIEFTAGRVEAIYAAEDRIVKATGPAAPFVLDLIYRANKKGLALWGRGHVCNCDRCVEADRVDQVVLEPLPRDLIEGEGADVHFNMTAIHVQFARRNPLPTGAEDGGAPAKH
jgi:hypothetical protein